jgi:hypothetical protein
MGAEWIITTTKEKRQFLDSSIINRTRPVTPYSILPEKWPNTAPSLLTP